MLECNTALFDENVPTIFVGPLSKMLFNGNRSNNYIFNRHILMETFVSCFDTFNFIDNIHSFNDFTKYSIAPFLHNGFTKHFFCSIIKECVVCYIDEKLSCRRMRIRCSCHGNCATFIAKSITCFVFNWCFSIFFTQATFHTTTLDHKSINNTVENCVIIETLFAIC
uniref:Uncharacterized protein n=1 Tax=Histophilus somni (strain 129Pt) TaxID=205914 RepID=Q0I1Q3_HISS1